jgi:hypothetical protein
MSSDLKFGCQASLKGLSGMPKFRALKLVSLGVFLNSINAFPIHHEACSGQGSDGKDYHLGMPLVSITPQRNGGLSLHHPQDQYLPSDNLD